MADQRQLEILRQGVEEWNEWYANNSECIVDLENADLSGLDLSGVNLCYAKLAKVNFSKAKLWKANLKGSQLFRTNLYLTDLTEADLSFADLYRAKLAESKLIRSVLYRAELNFADLYLANLSEANLGSAILGGAVLSEAQAISANFERADLSATNLSRCDLTRANLTNANLLGANLYRSDFQQANLSRADLQNTVLVETNLAQASLTDCHVYGLSAWSVRGQPKDQTNLVITPENQAKITVDDLQLAQFIYLLLNNENIRSIINTITSKAVLILGRFTPKRKEVLELIRQELSKYDYVPILFDFENAKSQSLLETVMTLAGMARFIIADVTAATMVREELRSLVEKYPSKPIQPILLQGETEYVSLPEMFVGFKSILPTYEYKESNDIIPSLSAGIIEPAERWLNARKEQKANGGKTLREIELEKQIETLQQRLARNEA